ncbi:MAG: hypothetical protein IPO37_02320 [Saprospiraceae bacterium]|nr:hypothetical protein [Saprospiraceae bacterium]
MIAPLTKHNIAGVIWYQGESNTKTHDTYQLLMTTLIDQWRSAWKKTFILMSADSTIQIR